MRGTPRRLLSLALLLVTGTSQVSPASGSSSPTGAVLHVPGDYPTIQAAILTASDGDEVLVSPGVYPENVSFRGKAIRVRSLAGPEVTTIDGSYTTAGPDSGSVVRFVDGEDANAILESFTLTGGTGTKLVFQGYTYYIGGGVGCIGSSPTVRNCQIKENSVAQF